MRRALRYHRWVYESFAPWVEGRALEVGSGHGIYTRWLREQGHEVVASDVDPRACAAVAAELAGDPGVSTVCMDGIEPDKVADRTIDTVVAVNVLEHIPDDARFVAAAAALLRRNGGGRLAVFVPASPALYGPMDSLAGHQRRYRRADVRRLLEGAGFTIRRLRPFNGVGGIGWWLNSKLARPATLADGAIASQIGAFNALVPVFRLLDPLCRPIGFGQSLVAWASVPG
jgi:SAM-dependent methyltransferase